MINADWSAVLDAFQSDVKNHSFDHYEGGNSWISVPKVKVVFKVDFWSQNQNLRPLVANVWKNYSKAEFPQKMPASSWWWQGPEAISTLSLWRFKVVGLFFPMTRSSSLKIACFFQSEQIMKVCLCCLAVHRESFSVCPYFLNLTQRSRGPFQDIAFSSRETCTSDPCEMRSDRPFHCQAVSPCTQSFPEVEQCAQGSAVYDIPNWFPGPQQKPVQKP